MSLPPITDHAFMRMVRKRVNAVPPVGMTRIANELGHDVDELCAWIVAYKEPKRKPYQNRGGPAIPEKSLPQREHWSMSRDAQRFANWRKAQAAAGKALAQ